MNPMNNQLMFDLITLKRQGVSPSDAMQKLARKYPVFQQAMPLLQGLGPQEMTMAAQSTAQHMGIDPGQVATQAREYLQE